MCRLPDQVYTRCKASNIVVFYADKGMTKFWNSANKKIVEPRYICGFYWYKEDATTKKAASAEIGPFRSYAAAARDAFIALGFQLDPLFDRVKHSQIKSLPPINHNIAPPPQPRGWSGRVPGDTQVGLRVY